MIRDYFSNYISCKTNTGYKFLISSQDEYLLDRYTWSTDSDGYLITTKWNGGVDTERYKLHRLIMCVPDMYIVDHINGDVSDNRRVNLRIADKSLNGLNSSKAKLSNVSTGIRNVYPARNKFMVRFFYTINGVKLKSVKYFWCIKKAEIFSIKERKRLIRIKEGELSEIL